MTNNQIDILIIGGGIAGLWLLHRLKRAGYDVLLLTDQGIGAGQTIAAQGIIHSGLKYTLAGKVNDLAKSISHMPERWRAALAGKGEIDLTCATMLSPSQKLMIPPGIAGSLIKIATKKTFDESVREGTSPYPGFNGHVLDMGEMVLDVPSVVRALAQPYKDCIKNADPKNINAKAIIYTAAAANLTFAEENKDAGGLKTQTRPLVMSMVKNALFPLFAHFVGASEKPVATVTTHKTSEGTYVWYLGGLVAEHPLNTPPKKIYSAISAAFKKYLPGLDTDSFEWATFPINRAESHSGTKGWMPDAPTIHQRDNRFYCYPTKLTFAPLLSDMVMKKIDFKPSGRQSDFSNLPDVDYAQAPWEEAQWTKLN